MQRVWKCHWSRQVIPQFWCCDPKNSLSWLKSMWERQYTQNCLACFITTKKSRSTIIHLPYVMERWLPGQSPPFLFFWWNVLYKNEWNCQVIFLSYFLPRGEVHPEQYDVLRTQLFQQIFAYAPSARIVLTRLCVAVSDGIVLSMFTWASWWRRGSSTMYHWTHVQFPVQMLHVLLGSSLYIGKQLA